MKFGLVVLGAHIGIHIKDEISKQKGLIASRMTGSGSSYFAIFEDRNATLLAEQQIKNYNSNWWTSIVSTI